MIEWLASICQENRLNEKWLLAQDMRSPQQWKDRLALAGYSSINLYSKTIQSIAIALSSEALAGQQLTLVNSATSRLILQNVVEDLANSNQLEYFDKVQRLDGLSTLLARSIQDLQLSEVEPDSVCEAAFDSIEKGRDLKTIYATYHERLVNGKLAGYAQCLHTVRRGLSDGSIVLPPDLLLLIPESLELYSLEQSVLDAIESKTTAKKPDHLELVDVDAVIDQIKVCFSGSSKKVELFAGFGEVNEVRGVARRILQNPDGHSNSLDKTEILYTDYEQYVPIIVDSLTNWLADIDSVDERRLSIDNLPVTFADGIACIYSRPGRALRCWLRWAGTDFVQSRVVQMIREGLVQRPLDKGEIGYTRLANTLRKIAIGFKSNRYVPKLHAAIQTANQQLKDSITDAKEVLVNASDREPTEEFGLAALEMVFSMIAPLIELAPREGDSATAMLNKVKLFLLRCARSDSKMDRLARSQLIDDIDGMLASIRVTEGIEFDVRLWLEDLPTESTILASGPLPGKVHVASLSKGAQTGRPNLFVVGLDDGRYPRQRSVDPILLDTERERLSSRLPTSKQLTEFQKLELDKVLLRHLENQDVRLVLSYSSVNLAEDRKNYPSTSLIELYRIVSGDEGARLDDLLHHLGKPDSFASESSQHHIANTDALTTHMLGETEGEIRKQTLLDMFSYLSDHQNAIGGRAATLFNSYDGFVPTAGVDLSPQNVDSVSASWLEDYGSCPRKFFFRRGLKAYAPDEWHIDHDVWLNPIQFGNLTHELFESFLREFVGDERIPELMRDRERLIGMLKAKVAGYADEIPVPNIAAFNRQFEQLTEMCNVFLIKEETYCRENNARPWLLEASVGTANEVPSEIDSEAPVQLTLNDGRILRVTGRIDRVDRLKRDGSERYAIWDYKSGSDYGYKKEDPFSQGRLLQPFLYVSVLRHRLSAIGRDADAVESFGYFFPNPRKEGLRVQWTRGQLRGGDAILQNICDAITAGVFPATTDRADCTYCEYTNVCGDPKFVALEAIRKVRHPSNSVLQPIRNLRDIEICTEDVQ